MKMIMEIDGKKHYLLSHFASMTNRGISTIRHLMFVGNRIRKLRYIEEPEGTYYIPIEEYTEFPFTSTGRYAQNKVYHYTQEGDYVQYTEEEISKMEKQKVIKETVNG